MQLVLISGLSGSGKSIALHVLEDAHYYVVDNLPATLLVELMAFLRAEGRNRVGVAVDIRSGICLNALPQQLEALRADGVDVRMLFLNARDETLIARFSETRRRHPLANSRTSLAEAIVREREALAFVAEMGHQIDTSELHPNSLRNWVKEFLAIDPTSGLTLMFESFGFKYGTPLDADLMFDVRCLPNPHYESALKPLTGRDPQVAQWLAAKPEVAAMCADIAGFIRTWLPHYMRDARSYLNVAIGCTGGQHRSVYLSEQLAAQFRHDVRVLVRHRSQTLRQQGQTANAPESKKNET